MKNTLSPNANNANRDNVLKVIFNSVFKLLAIGGFVVVVTSAISIPKNKLNSFQKVAKKPVPTVTESWKNKEKSTENKPVLSPYTIVLNRDNDSVDLILNNGVKINIENLSNKQEKCIIFGGGLGCIDSLYNPKSITNSKEEKATKYKINFSLTDEKVWIPIVVSLIICFMLFKGKK